MTDKPINEPTPESDLEFYKSTGFWNQLIRHNECIWPSWDILAAGCATVLAAILIDLMVPIKYMAGMVQWSILPMIGIVAVFVLMCLVGLVPFAFTDDDDYAMRVSMQAYSGFLFLFRWNAVMGIATIIAGCFVYLASYAVCWPYLIFLFLFFYTVLSTGTLFGTLARYGMFKYRQCREDEKETE